MKCMQAGLAFNKMTKFGPSLTDLHKFSISSAQPKPTHSLKPHELARFVSGRQIGSYLHTPNVKIAIRVVAFTTTC